MFMQWAREAERLLVMLVMSDAAARHLTKAERDRLAAAATLLSNVIDGRPR